MAEGESSRAWGGGGYNTFGGNAAGGSGSGSDGGGGGGGGGTGRPWAEVVDRSAFAKPSSLRDAFSRIKKNLSYFRRNYAIVILVLIGLSLLWRPISLVVLAVLVVAWIYLYFSRSGPFVIFNRSFGENLVLAFLIVVTIVALVFTPHAGTSLLVSILLGLAIVLLHAAFHTPDDSLPDQQEHASLLGKKAGVVGV